jgi:TolB-like protein
VILPVTESSHAVFLSYASQDAQAAQQIYEALRAAGIEVWFDQSELRGGDAWDGSIRKQIKACALFIPIISRNTHDRDEGYFRLEWKLAVDRCHLMAADKAFLLPVVVDGTSDQDDRVPDRFREVQWSRLPRGATTSDFVERVRRLLSGELSSGPGTSSATTRGNAAPTNRISVLTRWRSKAALLATIAVLVLAVGYIAANRLVQSKRGAAIGAAQAPAAQSAPATAFNPPPHSIAVLPFVNLSGDKEQDYFSDGLTEELLNSLAAIEGLQVAARTSSFSFKDHPEIVAVAHKLNVASVLEGSVRRSEHTVRVTAQLISAATGFHLWSKTYDRDLGDVLKLQTEIATAVADALKITLLGDVAAKIELGGTLSPAAFDAYLRASKAYHSRQDGKDMPSAIAAYTEAIQLDPNFALAFAGRSSARYYYAGYAATGPAIREGFEKAEIDARQAIALAPALAEGHLVLARVLEAANLDFVQAQREYERALSLAPGSVRVLSEYGSFAVFMGHFDAGIAAVRRAAVLDPIGRDRLYALGHALYYARQYAKAAPPLAVAIGLDPSFKPSYGYRGFALYGLGDSERARVSCETKRDYWGSQWCLAVAYEKLGRHADAEAEVGRMMATMGDSSAYQYAAIYAQWGDRAEALKWLDTSVRLRDPGLETLKVDPLMDPLRNEPHFQAIERALNFPK